MRGRGKLLLGTFVTTCAAGVMSWLVGERSLTADLTIQPRISDEPGSSPGRIEGAWTHFAADAGARQYSSLDQVSPANASSLQLAWVYRTGELSRRSSDEIALSAFANTPIIAGGSLIVCTPWNRVIALDPATGKERWVFDPKIRVKLSPGMRYVCRGIAAWRDAQVAADAPCAERLLFGTNDLRIFAIDARTGKPCTDFADHGELRVPMTPRDRSPPGAMKFNAPPMIVNGVAVFGSFVFDGARSDFPRGTVRAFDARTGAPKWKFEPVPVARTDPAWETWQNDSAQGFGGANAWPDLSADEARDLIFLPTSSAASDLYGGQRPGANLYANSTVALRASTGELIWHYQIVHHDIWDYDLPVAPLLADLRVDGVDVPAVIQLTKQGLVFVLHRETGRPLFPIEERPVPRSDTPGERAAATQPFPAGMPSLMPPALEPKDAWGLTFLDRRACRRRIEMYGSSQLYEPPSERGFLMFPLPTGGTNLGMRAWDPERRILIANTMRFAGAVRLARNSPAAPAGQPGPAPYRREDLGLMLSPLGIPCNPPPWGALTALDVQRQQILWEVPLGSVEKLAPVPLAIRWGTPNRGGPMVAKSGLIFIAATMDDAIRAFDTRTGEELWKRRLPAGGQATPMTYMVDGKQYIVIAAGGHDRMKTTPGDYVLAFALPDTGGESASGSLFGALRALIGTGSTHGQRRKENHNALAP